MNGKTKLFVVYAIFCVLHTCTAAATKCRLGVSWEADRRGTLEEAKVDLEEEECSTPMEACVSIKVDEIQVFGVTRECDTK